MLRSSPKGLGAWSLYPNHNSVTGPLLCLDVISVCSDGSNWLPSSELHPDFQEQIIIDRPTTDTAWGYPHMDGNPAQTSWPTEWWGCIYILKSIKKNWGEYCPLWHPTNQWELQGYYLPRHHPLIVIPKRVNQSMKSCPLFSGISKLGGQKPNVNQGLLVHQTLRKGTRRTQKSIVQWV